MWTELISKWQKPASNLSAKLNTVQFCYEWKVGPNIMREKGKIFFKLKYEINKE